MSLRAAINAKCKDCIYDPIGGGGSWLEQVHNCTSSNCPLFEVRPSPGKYKVSTLTEEEKAKKRASFAKNLGRES